MRCWVVVGSGLMYALDRCVFLLIDLSPMDMLPTAMFPRPMCVPLDQYVPPDARAFVLLPRLDLPCNVFTDKMDIRVHSF